MNRVLIVDDDPASRRLLEVRLRPLECDVATAGNGELALSAIRKDQPDLVLLDLQMPRMGGMDVLRALRQDAIEVPTIVITAHGSIEAAVEARNREPMTLSPSRSTRTILILSCAKLWSEYDSSARSIS